MPRKSTTAPAGEVTKTPPAEPDAIGAENENRSEQIQVVLPAADEPVRRGGHILTDQGWVAENEPVPTDEGDPAPKPEQE